jgi:Spy/CpxP family protein refolding chaperone
MVKTLTQLATFAVLASGLVLAQPPAGGRARGFARANMDPAAQLDRRINMLTARLGLTDSQKQQTTKIYTDAQTASQPLAADQIQNRVSLAAAVKKNDTAAINQLAASIGENEGKLTAIRSKADAAFYALLTPAQQVTYSQQMERMHNGGFGPGRGGAAMGGRRGLNR